MPFWNDGETSNEDPISSSDSIPDPDVPATIHDPDFCGMDTRYGIKCSHGEQMYNYVCFEGENTGRKFLGCARPGDVVCDKVHWIDGEWPPSLKRSVCRLWEMYDAEADGRLKDVCDHTEAYYKLNLLKEELEVKNKQLQIDLGKALSASQGSSSSQAASPEIVPCVQSLLDLHKFARDKAEKERDELKEANRKLEKHRDEMKEEKKKLEYGVFELVKEKEAKKEKLKKMKEILDEMM